MYDKVLGYIAAGKEGGANCVAGGDKVDRKGYYVMPTVFADVTDNMKIAREEVIIIKWGPILTILSLRFRLPSK